MIELFGPLKCQYVVATLTGLHLDFTYQALHVSRSEILNCLYLVWIRTLSSPIYSYLGAYFLLQ